MFRYTKVLVLLVTAVLQNCTVTLVLSTKENEHANLPIPRITRHEEVALATCTRRWQVTDNIWLKNLSRGVTTWTLSSVDLAYFVKNNTDSSIKTNMLLPNINEDAPNCLCKIFRYSIYLYLASWTVVETIHQDGMTGAFGTRAPFRDVQCPIGQGYEKKTFRLPILYFNSYSKYRIESVQRMQDFSALRNTVVHVACVNHVRLNYDGVPDCHSWQADIIFEAIAMRNVTVRKIFYKRLSDIEKEMLDGNIDVFGSIYVVGSDAKKLFAIPPIVTYWYESFYAKRMGPLPLSFYVILEKSKIALMLVGVTLLLTLLVLVAADIERIRDWSFNSVIVSFTFLLASFYSTSSTIPRIGRFGTVCSFICGLWLINILPFSNYFRGELTSRVTLRNAPEQIDNIDNLERALDEGKVAPCVVKYTYLHNRLLSKSSADTIHQKLHLAFAQNKDDMELEVSDYPDCLLCAHLSNRICFAYSLPNWYKLHLKRGLIESREPLSTLYMTILIRKSYPRRLALHKFVRRVIETSLLRQPEMFSKPEALHAHANQQINEPRPLELEELASFFLVFSALLIVCFIIGVLELLIRPKRIATSLA